MFDGLADHVGRRIIAREIYDGELWAARPLRLIAAGPDLLVAHFPRGSTWLRPVKLDGSVHRIPEEPWRLVETRWEFDNLWFVPAGQPFAIHAMRDEPNGELKGWYVNVQAPAQVTDIGFDYMDRTLDVIVDPTLATWTYKDEDELDRGVRIGRYAPSEATQIRDDAETGMAFLRDNEPRLRRWAHRHLKESGVLTLTSSDATGPGASDTLSLE